MQIGHILSLEAYKRIYINFFVWKEILNKRHFTPNRQKIISFRLRNKLTKSQNSAEASVLRIANPLSKHSKY